MNIQYKKLTFEQREAISILKASGKSLRMIASIIGKHHSSISRELKRNKTSILGLPHYSPLQAQKKARKRKSSASRKTRLRNPLIRDYVTEKLKLFWSPELIAGRIRIDHPGLCISHEAIYQFIYQEAWELFPFLVRKHKRRRLRFNHHKPRHLSIPNRTLIDQRPESINQRSVFGHWEGDSLVSRANSVSIHALVERKSRYLKLTKILRNSSDCVRNAIVRRLSPLKKSFRQSITYDNGSENFAHREVNNILQTQSYFCNPYHSWEKGSVENAIGIVRRFIPKKTNLQMIPSTEISQIENLINNRPKKCLNYKTPKEVFNLLCGAIPH